MTQRLGLYTDPLGHERREYGLSEARATGDDGLGFKGHAAVFNSRTWIGAREWGFFEEVATGAFDSALERQDDVRFVLNHDPNYLLARSTSGTLRLGTDKAGLAVDADMAPVTYARDISVLLMREDLREMSFAFRVIDDTWEELEVEDPDTGTTLAADLRTIRDVELFDVSVVTYPAYRDTDASLRAAGMEELAPSLGRQPRRRDKVSAERVAELHALECGLLAAKHHIYLP